MRYGTCVRGCCFSHRQPHRKHKQLAGRAVQSTQLRRRWTVSIYRAPQGSTDDGQSRPQSPRVPQTASSFSSQGYTPGRRCEPTLRPPITVHLRRFPRRPRAELADSTPRGGAPNAAGTLSARVRSSPALSQRQCATAADRRLKTIIFPQLPGRRPAMAVDRFLPAVRSVRDARLCGRPPSPRAWRSSDSPRMPPPPADPAAAQSASAAVTASEPAAHNGRRSRAARRDGTRHDAPTPAVGTGGRGGRSDPDW